MRPLVAMVLMVSLAGCFGAGPELSASDGAVTAQGSGSGSYTQAPNWLAGQQWQWESNYQLTSTDPDFAEYDEDGDGTIEGSSTMRFQVRNTSYEYEGERMHLGVLTTGENTKWSQLGAMFASDLWLGRPEVRLLPCDGCDLTWEFSFTNWSIADRPIDTIMQFPVRVGQTYTSTEPFWELDVISKTRILRHDTVSTAGETFPVVVAEQTFEATLGPEARKKLQDEARAEGGELEEVDYHIRWVRTASYSPVAMQIVHEVLDGVAEFTLRGTFEGQDVDESASEEYRSEDVLVWLSLKETAEQTMDDLIGDLNIRPFDSHYSMSIVDDNDRRNSAEPTESVFSLRIQGTEDGELPEGQESTWDLYDETGALIAEGNDATFAYTFDTAGVYMLRASSWLGPHLVKEDTHVFDVRTEFSTTLACDQLTITGTMGTCETASIDVPESVYYMDVRIDMDSSFDTGNADIWLEHDDGSTLTASRAGAGWRANGNNAMAAGTWTLHTEPEAAFEGELDVRFYLYAYIYEYPEGWSEPPLPPGPSAAPAPPTGAWWGIPPMGPTWLATPNLT